MKLTRAFALARRNLAVNRRGAALSAFGVAIGVACLVFFTGLGAGISHVVRTRVLPVDASLVEVKPSDVSLGGLLGGGTLDAETLPRLRTLAGVVDLYPKMEVRQPSSSRFNGDFFGKPMKLYTEIIAQGLDPRLVQADLAAGRTFDDPGPGKPVPVLANSRLLELYNKTFAPQRGLPKLTPEMLAGFQMPVAWGQSFVAGNSDKAQFGTVELAGFSTSASPLGLAMPLEAARRLNRDLGRDADTYTSVVLRVDSPERIAELTDAVRRMGFDVDDGEQRLARQVGFGITVVTSALAALSLLITLLAAVNIAHAFYAQVRERRREIGLMRALGASRRDVLVLLLSEAAIVGLGGGLAGVLAGLGAVRLIDLAALSWLPDFPYKPETFFLVTPGALLMGLGVAAAAAMGGALGPARTASASDPSVALTE